MYQEDFYEFNQIAHNLLTLRNEQLVHFESIKDDNLKNFFDEVEKLNDQIESIGQKRELLLQNSNKNQIEYLLETINRNYNSLIVKTKTSLNNLNKTHRLVVTMTDNV